MFAWVESSFLHGLECAGQPPVAVAAGAGLRVARVVPTPTPFSVVEVVAGG